MSSAIYLGIDLGDHGALAWLGPERLHLDDMPVVKVAGRYEIDIPAMWELFRGDRKSVVVAERLHPMPSIKGGAAANFKRGGYMYLVRTMCHASGVPLLEVAPQRWQRHFGYAKKRAAAEGVDTKGFSYLRASKFFPDAKFKTERGRLLDGRCDAALLALYGRQVWTATAGK